MEQSHTFLITGASHGPGRALAQKYAESDQSVFGCACNASDLAHENYQHIVANISDEESVSNIFQEVSASGGEIDVLLNNASDTFIGPTTFNNTLEAERIFSENFFGIFTFLRETIRYIKRVGRGRIIHILWADDVLERIGGAVYNASNLALQNLGYYLSQEITFDDITINNISLSCTDGAGMASNWHEKSLTEKKVGQATLNQTDIEEIVHGINFFISNEARNIINQTGCFGEGH